MIQERQWIGALRRKFLDGIYRARDREKLELLIEQFENACDLSRGPNPDRAKYWEREALIIRHRLGEHAALPFHEWQRG